MLNRVVGRVVGRVVACVIEREGRLLVCQRPAHKRHGGLWEFPGGKLEEGETHLDGARRELGEELGIEVTDVGPVDFADRARAAGAAAGAERPGVRPLPGRRRFAHSLTVSRPRRP